MSEHQSLVAQLTTIRQEFLDYCNNSPDKNGGPSSVSFTCGNTAWEYNPVATKFLRAIIVKAGKLLQLIPQIVFRQPIGWLHERTPETRWYRFLLEFDESELLERSGRQSIVWNGECQAQRKVSLNRRGERRGGWLPRFHLISINAIDWLRFRMEEELPIPSVENAKPRKPVAEETTHSTDFTSVKWFGACFQFAKGQQAESVRVLWQAWKNETPTLSEKTIAEEIGSSATDSFQLAKVFRTKKKGRGYKNHPAWGTMIVRSAKGTYQLAPPKKSKQDQES